VAFGRRQDVHGHTCTILTVAHHPTATLILEAVATLQMQRRELLVVEANRLPVRESKLDQATRLHATL